jgi:hypothetical protein
MDPIYTRLQAANLLRFLHLLTSPGVIPIQDPLIFIPQFYSRNQFRKKPPILVPTPDVAAALELGGAGQTTSGAAAAPAPNVDELPSKEETLLENKVVASRDKVGSSDQLEVHAFRPGKRAAKRADPEKILAEEGHGSARKKPKAAPKKSAAPSYTEYKFE